MLSIFRVGVCTNYYFRSDDTESDSLITIYCYIREPIARKRDNLCSKKRSKNTIEVVKHNETATQQ